MPLKLLTRKYYWRILLLLRRYIILCKFDFVNILTTSQLFDFLFHFTKTNPIVLQLQQFDLNNNS